MQVYNYSSFSRHQKGKKKGRRGSQFKHKRTHLGLFNNPFKLQLRSINSFYFQIAGIVLITAGVVISFQTLMDISTPSTSASSSSERDSVRVLTNFQTETKRSSTPKIEPITVQEEESETDEVEPVEQVKTAKEQLEVYVVKPNDNLYTIAQLFGISDEEFIEVNGLIPPYSLTVGQQLLVPNVE